MSRTLNPPSTRHDRRKLELEQRREQRRAARERPAAAPLRSPMAMVTGAALLVGVLIVGFMWLSRPAAPTVNDLEPPAEEIPFGAVADGRTLGNADAKVTVEIWSDFQCPACMNFAKNLEPDVITNYVVTGKVKLVYRDAAFQGQKSSSPYDESVQSAAAARCAADQGLFWQMHNWLFANWKGENEGAFAGPRLTAIATAAGLDMTLYEACMATGSQQAAVVSETDQGVAAGIRSTPTLIINGTTFVGAPRTFAEFAPILDQAYAEAQ